jgi:hypothetical protein
MARSVLGLFALVALALSSGVAMAGGNCGGQIVHTPISTTVASAEGDSSTRTPIIVPSTGG